MTSSKNLLKMAKRAFSLPSFGLEQDSDRYKTCSVADKGHFVIYTADQRRVMLPLACLDSEIFRELLKLSEDEFGLPTGGPITLPCDAFFVDHVVSLMNQGSGGELEKDLILSVVSSRCLSPALSLHQQIARCSY